MINSPAPKKRQNTASFWAAFAAVFFVCLFVLYAGENRGVSDNGDFRRVMLVNNLSYENETDSAYLFKQYYTMKLEGDTLWQKAASLFDTTMEGELYSSPHFAAIKASKLLNFGYNLATQRPLESYNICFLALIYIFLLALSGGLTVRFFGRFGAAWQIGAAVLFLFIFCDAGYVLYFNSLYGEPLQYVCLLLCIALGLTFYQNPKNLLSMAAFFISLYFFAGAKLANIPFALLCCLASVAWLWRMKGKWKKAALCVLVVAATASLGVLYKSIPAWMDYDTTYQAVFFGILKESPTPKADVKSLGLPEEYAALAGTHAYMQSYPINTKDAAFTQNFYETTGKADVVAFYLTHPVRFVQKLSVAVRNSAHIRPSYLGTSPSVPMSQQARFSFWSDLRIASRFLYHPFLVLPALLLLALGAAFWLFNGRQKSKKHGFAPIRFAFCGRYMVFAGNSHLRQRRSRFGKAHVFVR